MPTYDYKCTACGYKFEHFQAMSDEALTTCPECGGELKRLIGGGLGVIFKGSGFYVTDNRKGGGGRAGSSAGGSDSRSDSRSDGGKTEKKEGTGKKSEASSAPVAASTSASDKKN